MGSLLSCFRSNRTGPCSKSMLNFLHLGGSKKEPTPDLDPFYGYTSTTAENIIHQPGTLLRVRSIQLSEFPGFDADHLQGWQLAYVTRGQTQEEATVTVATIIVPANVGDRDKLIFIAPKTDAASPTCRTSYMLRRGSGSLTGAASEQIFMIDFLKRGWTCVQVDHQGQHDAFGAGPTAGHALLDAIRATLVCPELDLPSPHNDKLKIALWGYSGGAIAVGWAAQMLHTYAPELAPIIKAISHGGIPCDMNAVAVHVNDGLAAGLIIGVMRGLANVYRDLDAWLQSNTNEHGKRMLQLARTGCFFSFMTRNTFDDVLNLKPGGRTQGQLGCFTTDGNPLTLPILSRIMNENDMLTAVAALTTLSSSEPPAPIPMFIYQSTNDEVVPLQTVDQLATLWMRSKYVILDYHKVPLLPHVATIFAMHSQNVQWIADRFENKKMQGGHGDGTPVEVDVAVNDENAKQVLGQQRGKELQTFYDEKYKGSLWW